MTYWWLLLEIDYHQISAKFGAATIVGGVPFSSMLIQLCMQGSCSHLEKSWLADRPILHLFKVLVRWWTSEFSTAKSWLAEGPQTSLQYNTIWIITESESLILVLIWMFVGMFILIVYKALPAISFSWFTVKMSSVGGCMSLCVMVVCLCVCYGCVSMCAMVVCLCVCYGCVSVLWLRDEHLAPFRSRRILWVILSSFKPGVWAEARLQGRTLCWTHAQSQTHRRTTSRCVCFNTIVFH